jgi:hypothetical protein
LSTSDQTQNPGTPASPRSALRCELDVRGEREAAVLRIVGAVVATIAGAWLFALPYTVPRLFALAGFAFAALWTARALRMRRRFRNPAEHYLELGADALRLRDGAELHEVPWREVQAVSVDEDRLVLRIARRDAAALEIEPRYRGVALHALCDAIRAARYRATGRGGCATAADG